jgi:hypothetical protein
MLDKARDLGQKLRLACGGFFLPHGERPAKDTTMTSEKTPADEPLYTPPRTSSKT